MITKAQVKHIRALADKKYRQEHCLFVVEGEKLVKELVTSGLKIKEIFATQNWIEKQSRFLIGSLITEVQDFELERISSLTTPNQVLALVEIPSVLDKTPDKAILLENIKDPGNLGTIIRIADWYGISTVYCSEHSVDCFNTKVIQASMGSIFRVDVIYRDLHSLVDQHQDRVVAAALNGTNLNIIPSMHKAWLLMGNESEGLSTTLLNLCKHIYSIPKLGSAESLNVAVATGIFSQALYGTK